MCDVESQFFFLCLYCVERVISKKIKLFVVSLGRLNNGDIVQRSSSMVNGFPSTVMHIVQESHKEFELPK